MTKIRTAEELLTHYKGFINLSSLDSNLVIGIMQEYAKQFIDLAAEELSNTHNSDTILKLKERVV